MKCKECGIVKKTHRCIGCKELFCEDHIFFAPDPYSNDIYDDDTSVWECKDCRYESAMDI